MPVSAPNQSARALASARLDGRAILPAGARSREVGAIDRKMQDEQFERGAQTFARVVAGGVVAGRDPREQPRQYGELARQDVGNHAPLGLDQNLVEAALIAARLAPRLLERAKTAIIDKHARDHVEPFVAGGARDAGKARQALAVGEDLFDDDIEPAARRSGWFAIDQALQAAEIVMRVAQPVDVVEPQPMQAARRRSGGGPGRGWRERWRRPRPARPASELMSKKRR